MAGKRKGRSWEGVLVPCGAGGCVDAEGGVVVAGGALGHRGFVAGVEEAAVATVELAPVESYGKTAQRRASQGAHERGEVKETGGSS